MRRSLPLFALLQLLAAPLHAAVNDIFPGDYFPGQPGSTSLAWYAFDRVQRGPYMQERKALDGRLDTSTLALRLTRTYRVAGTTLTSVLALPWVNIEATPGPLATALGVPAQGLADLRLGITAWPINDPHNAHYLGIGAMIIAPSGDYDDRHLLNTGENRWKLVLSGGWQKDITPQWLVELAPEIALYGDNQDYPGQRRLAQRSQQALTGYLRWRATAVWHAHLGGQVNRNGATRIDGVDQHNPANNTRLMAGVTWFLPEKQQIILRAARDTRMDNGFLTTRELALRYLKTF